MKPLFLLLSSLLIFGCSHNQATNKDEETPKSKIINEVTRKAARNLNDSDQLQLIGTGSQVKDKIKMLSLSFNYYKPATEDKARKLLLKSATELISLVNQNDRIRPHLANYPFDIKNVEIRIYLYNREGKSPPAGALSVASTIDGIFTYKIDDPKEFLLISHRETYEEAMSAQAKASNF